MYAYSRIEYECELMNELVEKEMQRHKKNAVQAISKIVHFELESFTKMLVYCWQESLPAAQTLIDHLDFSKLDLLALADDFDGFKEEFLKNYEEAQNF